MFYKRLTQNGWNYQAGDGDFTQFQMTITAGYDYKCTAHVVRAPRELYEGGNYGVQFIEVECLDFDNSYTKAAIEDMLLAIELAENNLLLIGIPFDIDYEFTGNNAGRKSRRNFKLRLEWKLEEIEREGGKRNAER